MVPNKCSVKSKVVVSGGTYRDEIFFPRRFHISDIHVVRIFKNSETDSELMLENFLANNINYLRIDLRNKITLQFSVTII